MAMNIEFSAIDGVTLKGQLITAKHTKAVVILNPGTATKTTFYLPFAEFLAKHGYSVLLWNYRGFCESRTGSLKDSNIRFSDIGLYDIPAAISKAQDLFPDLPIYCVGHSAGGQQLGFAHNCNALSGMVGIAVSTGYFHTMPLAYRLKAIFFFSVICPISTALFGYVKAKLLNIMEDLPPKLAKEWGQWCSQKDFFFAPQFYQSRTASQQYQKLAFPIHIFTADDDEISTPANTKALWSHISSDIPPQFTWYQSAEMTNHKVGHFGYFRKENRTIWQDILTALDGFNSVSISH